MGFSTAKLYLHIGASDFGSIMIKENVVSEVSASYLPELERIKRLFMVQVFSIKEEPEI